VQGKGSDILKYSSLQQQGLQANIHAGVKTPLAIEFSSYKVISQLLCALQLDPSASTKAPVLV